VDYGTVCSDAGTVADDAGTVQDDLGTIHDDQGSSGNDAASLTPVIKQLQQAQAALDADRSSDVGDVPSNAASDAQISQAISGAQAKVRAENGTTGSALSQAQGMFNTAQGYANKAQAACSSAGG
jgi:hypothetical protein